MSVGEPGASTDVRAFLFVESVGEGAVCDDRAFLSKVSVDECPGCDDRALILFEMSGDERPGCDDRALFRGVNEAGVVERVLKMPDWVDTGPLNPFWQMPEGVPSSSLDDVVL
jgi:hypothetical protein